MHCGWRRFHQAPASSGPLHPGFASLSQHPFSSRLGPHCRLASGKDAMLLTTAYSRPLPVAEEGGGGETSTALQLPFLSGACCHVHPCCAYVCGNFQVYCVSYFREPDLFEKWDINETNFFLSVNDCPLIPSIRTGEPRVCRSNAADCLILAGSRQEFLEYVYWDQNQWDVRLAAK